MTGTDPDGSDWTPASDTTTRFIFHIRVPQRYGPAVTQAMKSLLMTLP
ncbi:MAG TPA: hypothetical protein PLT20_07595 [Sedimentisphaerales bacterium]|nr:hypothetical protein [Sedimentisphaerales bacterium]HQI27933.1 hypothetical protein [Sedimentisphaerales bacterium]